MINIVIDKVNMDKLSSRRLAENEVIFKQVNTEIKDFILEDGQETEYAHKRLRFYCECSNIDCFERINITAREYDDVHNRKKLFVVKIGHSMPEIEKVINKTDDYEVVEKKAVPPAPEDIDPKKLL